MLGRIGALALISGSFPMLSCAEHRDAEQPPSRLPTQVASAVPMDSFGRPLVDEATTAPLYYRRATSGWLERNTSGPWRQARLPRTAAQPPLVSPSTGADQFSLGDATLVPTGSWPSAVAIGDITGDGLADVALTTSAYFDAANDYHLFVFQQLADGTLAAAQKYRYNATANRNGLALGDVNEDGAADVIVGHGSGITVFQTDGSGGLLTGEVITDADANTVTISDVDLDGHLDVISVGWSRGGSILYGDGKGAFPTIAPLSTAAAGYNDHEVEDVTGDGFVDAVIMSGQSNLPNISVHVHDGVAGYPAAATQYNAAAPFTTTRGVGAGDINGDALHDVVLTRGRNSPTWLFLMHQNDSGALKQAVTIPSYDIPGAVVVADIDGDLLEDVIVAHGGWQRVGVYLQGHGELHPEVLYPVPYASSYPPQGIAIGDVNGDKCGDVALADYNNGLVVLYGDGCTNQPPPSDAGVPDAAPPDAAIGRDAPDAATPSDAMTTTDASDGVDARTVDATAGNTDAIASVPEPQPQPATGCVCRNGAAPDAGTLLLLAAVIALGWRRRRQSLDVRP